MPGVPTRYNTRLRKQQNSSSTSTSQSGDSSTSIMSTDTFSPEDLGIDVTKLSSQNKELVRIILLGTKTHMERLFATERATYVEKVDKLENEICLLKEKQDDLENYGRRNTLVISGLSLNPVSAGENCVDIAVDLFKQHLDLQDFSRNDVDIAHRLGKPKTDGPDRRNIIVKLTRRENKHRILQACRRKKPQSLYVNESVSKSRSTIMYVLRKVKKDFPEKIGSAMTEDCNVRVLLPSQEEPRRSVKHTVNTRRELEALLLTKLGHNSSRYNPRWL